MIDGKRISVAMATFNGEAYIAEQLNSILRQTVVPDEIIICDDGSTDNTLAILETFRERYPEIIQIHRNENNLGVSKNFEKAITLTTGDFIFLSDQDDVWNSEKIRKLYELMSSSQSPAGAFCNSTITDEALRPTGVTHWELRGFGKSLPEPDLLKLSLKRVPAAGHDMAFDARLKEVLLPFPPLPECHDTWIGLTLATLGAWRVCEECLTEFRQHSKNVSGSGKKTSLRDQFRAARHSVKGNTFDWNTRLYGWLLERVGPCCSPETLRLLEERRAFSLARTRMNVPLYRRIPMIFNEIRCRRYFRYGRGWKNILQDLFLR